MKISRAVLTLAAVILSVMPAACSGSGSGRSEARSADVADANDPAAGPHLYAVQYGASQFPQSVIFHDAAAGSVPFGWLFYVFVDGEQVTLIDTGFRNEMLRQRFGIEWQDPKEILRSELGITPSDVDTIVLTHYHFDHAGTIHDYPDATIVIHRHDLKMLTESRPLESAAAHVENPSTKIVTFDDSFDVEMALHIEHVGGHTPGSSIIRVAHGEKRYLLTGDEAYLRANVEQIRPSGELHDSEASRRFLETASTSDAAILTFHDPEIVGSVGSVKQVF